MTWAKGGEARGAGLVKAEVRQGTLRCHVKLGMIKK